jgi:hypothetical protein
MRVTALFSIITAVAAAQTTVTTHNPDSSAVHGTEPKSNVSEYPANALAFDGKATVGAEFMGHTVAGEQTSFVVDDYIVVEVAIYPNKGQTVPVAAGAFQLRIDGKRVALPQSAQAVAASMKYPDWSRTIGGQAEAGLGDERVSIGRPGQVGRFPGDPSGRDRYPRNPPQQTSQTGTTQAKQQAHGAAVYSALVEGPTRGPVSGLLYFEYKGKLKKIKSLELLIRDSSDQPKVLAIR